MFAHNNREFQRSYFFSFVCHFQDDVSNSANFKICLFISMLFNLSDFKHLSDLFCRRGTKGCHLSRWDRLFEGGTIFSKEKRMAAKLGG